jgi:serine/threonine protein phosphatase PrpC
MAGAINMLNHESVLTHVAGCLVDIGRERPTNEDVAAAMDIGWTSGVMPRPVSLYIVADGMGGHRDGEVASKMTLDTVVQQIVGRWRQSDRTADEDYGAWLQNAAQAANRKIYAMNCGDKGSGSSDMGTTLVMALVVGQDAYVANIGDSRAYQISRSGISQITTDHSVVQGLVAAGAITPQQAKKHPFRNYITQAVGTDEDMKADLFTMQLDPDTSLLLCSDGLTKELEDNAIYNAIQTAKSPQAACDKLVASANFSGGHDNIAVVLVQAQPSDEPTL